MPENHNDCLFPVSQYSKSFLYIKQLSSSFNVHDYAYSFPYPANVLLPMCFCSAHIVLLTSTNGVEYQLPLLCIIKVLSAFARNKLHYIEHIIKFSPNMITVGHSSLLFHIAFYPPSLQSIS